MTNLIPASAIISFLYANANDDDSVALAEIDIKDWDGKYPAFFTQVAGRFTYVEYAMVRSNLKLPAFLENECNTPEYSKRVGGAGRVWVPLDRVEGYDENRSTHFGPLVETPTPAPKQTGRKKSPRKKAEDNETQAMSINIDGVGAQNGESRVPLLPAASEVWTREVGLRLKALEEDRRQKEAVPTQGDYLEDWEGVEVKE